MNAATTASSVSDAAAVMSASATLAAASNRGMACGRGDGLLLACGAEEQLPSIQAANGKRGDGQSQGRLIAGQSRDCLLGGL